MAVIMKQIKSHLLLQVKVLMVECLPVSTAHLNFSNEKNGGAYLR